MGVIQGQVMQSTFSQGKSLCTSPVRFQNKAVQFHNISADQTGWITCGGKYAFDNTKQKVDNK